ncbi:MAG: DUF3187 family protein, partial [Deltaproteobacteria bacterium]|nr:DUF3187 family protein [Deltaproteobacteria bacterium]
MQRSLLFWRGLSRFSLMAGLSLLLAVVCPLAAPAKENTGLGPLTISNQFPPTLPYLGFSPESTETLSSGRYELRYQYSRTNTFINSQSPRLKRNQQTGLTIDAADVAIGLTAANFPPSGYGMYLDMEADRHRFRFLYGFSDRVELGLDLSWLSFSGGFMDDKITLVERLFGGLNKDREYSALHQFDYYLYKDGVPIHEVQDTPQRVMQDPVLKMKWAAMEGGNVLPAVSLLLTLKPSVIHNSDPVQRLAASGGQDRGWAVLISKAVDDVVGHVQVGKTYLNVNSAFYEKIVHYKLFGMEYRLSERNSFIVQSLSRSSMFLRSSALVNPTTSGPYNYGVSRPSDISVWGFIHRTPGFVFELG